MKASIPFQIVGHNILISIFSSQTDHSHPHSPLGTAMYRLQTLASCIQSEISITKHKLQIPGNIGKIFVIGPHKN